MPEGVNLDEGLVRAVGYGLERSDRSKPFSLPAFGSPSVPAADPPAPCVPGGALVCLPEEGAGP